MRLFERFRPSPLASFFVKGVLMLLVLTALWASIADWTMRPAAAVATVALKTAFPWWVTGSTYRGDTLEVATRIELPVAGAPRGAKAELVAEATPAHYGFGLPMLLALLLASGSRRPGRKMVIGAVCLIPFQAFSIFFVILKQVTLASGTAAASQVGLSGWQIEAVALCYQLGVLLLPALVPIVLWLVLDRSYLAALVLEGELRHGGVADR